MIKFYKILFFNTMMIGTLISISSYSWMSMWMGLEINLLSIIPLMKSSKNIFPSEAAIKYFITQTFASSILLFSIIMNLNLNEFIPYNSILNLNMLMNSAFLMKMGAAPFHFWFPEVMEGLNWSNCLIMLTWQKIAPMVLISYNNKIYFFLTIVVIVSSMISGTLGMNQISLRKILTFSSINHIGWMISAMFNSISIWLIYFITYSIITINLILIFKIKNVFFLKQLFNCLKKNKLLKIFFILNFLSLGGLPPFMGFMPKWLTVNFLIQMDFFMLSMGLIVFTIMTLFFYMRVSFNSMMIKTNETMMKFLYKINFLIFLSNLISLMGMLTMTLIFNFF